MSIGPSDYFGWYNEEITRYRDHEWQLSSYSIAISLAIILFSRNSETKGLIAPWVGAAAIAITVGLFLFAQFHTHKKLNEYRKRRSLLIHDKRHDGNISFRFFSGAFDKFYFLGFVAVPLMLGAGAVWILLSAP